MKPGDIELKANVFNVVLKKDFEVHLYDLELLNLKDEKMAKRMSYVRRVYQTLLESHGDELGFHIYDGGHQLFLLKPLADPAKTFSLKLSERSRFPQDVKLTFRTAIEFHREAEELSPIIRQFLSLFLRQEAVRGTEGLEIKKVKLLVKNRAESLPDSELVVKPGFIHTFLMSASHRLLLNTDLGFSVESSGGDLMWYLCIRARSLGIREIDRFDLRSPEGVSDAAAFLFTRPSKMLRVLELELARRKVSTTHLPQSQTMVIESLAIRHRASTEKFDMRKKDEESREITVQDYYREKYGIELKHPDDFPLVCVKKKFKGDSRKLFFPLQVLKVCEGQMRPLSRPEREKVTGLTRRDLDVRMREIEDHVGHLPTMRSPDGIIDIAIERDPVCAKGVVLAPPTVAYQGSELKTPGDQGEWNLRDVHFLAPCLNLQLKVLAPRSVDSRTNDDSLGTLLRIAGNSGLKLQVATPRIEAYEDDADLFDHLRMSDAEGTCVLVVLPDKDSSRYNSIKTMCELSKGLATQCITVENWRGLKPAVAANIAAAINVKARCPAGKQLSENMSVKPLSPIMTPKTLIVGIDVHYPQSNSLKPPEVALAGSLNRNITRFFSVHRVLHSGGVAAAAGAGRSSIDDLDAMLQEYFAAADKAGLMPADQIIVLRDGISEGEMPIVVPREVAAFKLAMAEYLKSTKSSAPEPKVLFVVVQKKSSVRLVAKDGSEILNPPPGTFLHDASIAAPKSFYMISYAALQGSPRPVFCRVVHDDMSLKLSMVEDLMYRLCYLHPGCTRAISVPIPLYSAARFALRVGTVYRSSQELDVSDTVSVVSDSSSGSGMARAVAPLNLSDELKSTAFYL